MASSFSEIGCPAVQPSVYTTLSEQKITLKNDDKRIILHIGKPEIGVDGEKLNLDEDVPMIKNDLTFLPVRQLAEILGVKVEWDADTRTATFTDKE